MREIAVVDSCVLLTLLQVPMHAQRADEVFARAEELVENDGAILLPMATLLETGNHIADVPGGQRYHLAELFAEIAGAAVAERPSRVEALALPVTPTYPLMPEHVRLWIHEFPEQAKQKGFGFADRSIIDAFHQTVRLNQGRHVFIWSTDSHLEKAEFDYTPTF